MISDVLTLILSAAEENVVSLQLQATLFLNHAPILIVRNIGLVQLVEANVCPPISWILLLY